MHRVLSSLQTSANQKIELATTLTRWIYLERSVRNLCESEEKAMECVNNGISGLPRPYVEGFSSALLESRIFKLKNFAFHRLLHRQMYIERH